MKSLKKKQIPTLSATNEVSTLHFTSESLPPESGNNQPQELVKYTLAVTPQEKAEILEAYKRLGAAKVQQLFLQALKQAKTKNLQ